MTAERRGTRSTPNQERASEHPLGCPAGTPRRRHFPAAAILTPNESAKVRRRVTASTAAGTPQVDAVGSRVEGAFIAGAKVRAALLDEGDTVTVHSTDVTLTF
jgi:hypothetical protein